MRKLRHLEVKELALERLKVIRPLCEEALGRRIGGEVTIRVHGRFISSFLVDVWYPIKKAIIPPPGSIPEDGLSRTLSVLSAPFLFALRGAFGLIDSNFRPMAGYAITGENVILLISSSAVISRAKELDYFIAHEVTHLLSDDLERIPKTFGCTIYEGVATYYGEQVTRRLHPGFSVLDSGENRLLYLDGYTIMRKIAELTHRDPLRVLVTLSIDDFDDPSICLRRLFPSS